MHRDFLAGVRRQIAQQLQLPFDTLIDNIAGLQYHLLRPTGRSPILCQTP